MRYPLLTIISALLTPTLFAASLMEVASRDAELRCLAAVDVQHGFAVGDRGVALRTDDGGRSWTTLETPVECPLYGVSFLDRKNGWAVGGYGKPLSDATRGVVLRTRDGGATWTQLSTPTLPLLRWVRFFDRKRGVAVGGGEAFHPSGVFVTGDGGRSWHALPGDRPRHWQAADFFAPGFGVAAGARGELGMIAKQEVRPVGATAGDRRGYQALQVAGTTTAWLVGDGGAVYKTDNAGRSWLPPPGALPSVANAFDWHSVATHGDHVWITGSPGAVVLHSADAGRTWQMQSTSMPLPLNAIVFADERHGWAAGALGTLLVTDDGGQNWRIQRQGGQRFAMDVLIADPADTPVELLAKSAAADGYLVSVGTLFGDQSGRDLATHTVQVAESTVAAGGSHATSDWRLPLTPVDRTSSAEQLLHNLNRKMDGQAAQELHRMLVTRLRALRPSAVMLVDPAESASPGAATLLATAMEVAIRDAADPAVLPELGAVGVSSWKVPRVYQLTADGLRSRGGFSTSDFNSQLGTSVAQWASAPRRLLQAEFAVPPSRVGWHTVLGAAGTDARRDDPLAHFALLRGDEARRSLATPPTGNLDQLRTTARKRHNMQQLLARTSGDSKWAGQVVNLTGGLDADSGAELLFQLATGYREAGKLDLAADTFYLLAKRYYHHPLADPALVWLLRYYASSEMALRAAAGAQNLREPRPLANVISNDSNREPLQSIQPTVGALSSDDRFERGTRIATYLRDARPELYADPAIRFPVIAAKRRLGYEKDADRILLLLSKQAIDPAWRRAADAERWLAKPTELPPEKPIAICKSIAHQPKLDGDLADDCWPRAERIRLTTGDLDTQDAGVLRFVRDDDFLFIAIDCPMIPTADYRPPATARTRDADLKGSDRVTLKIDTDRDYTTSLELTVDAAGRLHDGITSGPQWRDRRWDPQWFVAARQHAGRWTIEAAVPIGELAKPAPTPRDVWGVGVIRHLPSGATATWTGVDDSSPDHYGLLLMR